MSETAEPAGQQAFATYVPGSTNFAMIALRVLTAAGLVIGGILLIVGASVNANVNEFSVALNGADPVPGFGALIWGGSIFSIGIMAAFSLLAAMAVRWTPPK